MPIKYLVGIDFGHGETTASCVDVSSGDIQHLRINDGNKEDSYKISSAIYRKPNADGTYEYSLRWEKGYGVCVSFKFKISALQDPNLRDERDAFKNFIKLVYQEIIRRNRSISQEDGLREDGSNFLLYIASPTEWSAQDKLDYKRFVEQAVGRSVGWVINESDAAYYKKRESNGLILVVDYGSSTIDFTLMYNNVKINIDELSNQLGAQDVEKHMWNAYKWQEDSCDHYRQVKDISERNLRMKGYTHIDVDTEILYNLRRKKEDMYTHDGLLSYFGWSFQFNKKFLDINGVKPFGKNFEQDEEELLKDYMDHVSACFGQVKNEIDRICKERGIKDQLQLIVSGGASRMPWVRKKLSEAFQIPLETIELKRDDRPEYIVSDGIVNYAYELYQVKEEIAPIVNDLKDWLLDLEDEMHQIISDVCQDICLKEIQQDKAIISYLSDKFQDDTVIDTDPRNSYYHNYYKSSVKGFVRIVDGINKRIYKNRKDINEEIFKRLNERIHEELDPMLRKSMLRLFHVEVSALNLLRGNQGILPLIQDNFTIGSDKLDEITDCCLERVGWCSWFNVNTLYGDESHEGTIRKDRGPNDRNRIARAYYDFIRETEFAPYSIGTIKDNIYNYVLDNIVSTVKDHLTFDPCGYDMKAEILSELERLRPFTARITSCEGKCVVVQRMEGMPKEEDTIEVEAEGLPTLTALIKNVPSMNEWIRLTLDTEIPEAYLGGTVRKI